MPDHIIDAHCHLYSTSVLTRVLTLREKLESLGLQFDEANERLTEDSLLESADASNVSACVVLLTARSDRIRGANDEAIRIQRAPAPLFALGTAHPDLPDCGTEIERLLDSGIRGLKFSSFSQGIDFNNDGTGVMLDGIERQGRERGVPITVVLDTFVGADRVFGASPEYITKPAILRRLAVCYPGIRFVGAHMGGLSADPAELIHTLIPAPNLYLDTSNAAHTLPREAFVTLLRQHGSGHILFGTDWPWFDHRSEIPLIDRLLSQAGFDKRAKGRVFGGNAEELLLPSGWMDSMPTQE